MKILILNKIVKVKIKSQKRFNNLNKIHSNLLKAMMMNKRLDKLKKNNKKSLKKLRTIKIPSKRKIYGVNYKMMTMKIINIHKKSSTFKIKIKN